MSDSKRTDEVEVGADLGSELFHDAAVTLLRVSEPTEVRFVVIHGPRVERVLGVASGHHCRQAPSTQVDEIAVGSERERRHVETSVTDCLEQVPCGVAVVVEGGGSCRGEGPSVEDEGVELEAHLFTP